MAPVTTWVKKTSLPAVNNNYTAVGLYTLKNQRLVAITGNVEMYCYVSDDEGNSWTQTHQFPEAFSDPQIRAGKVGPSNMVVAISDADQENAWVYTSTNSGTTWQQTAHYNTPFFSPFDPIWAGAALSYGRNTIILGGRFRAAAAGSQVDFLKSTDGGVSWIENGVLVAGARTPKPMCLAASPGGVWLCGSKQITGTAPIYRSTNFGATWSATGAYPVPADNFPDSTWINSIAFVTDSIAIACGQGNAMTSRDYAYLYRSTDTGLTWTHIPPSSIAGWPLAVFQPLLYTTKRLTKTMCMFGAGPNTFQARSLLRISYDAGLTYSEAPTGLIYGSGQNALCAGAITTNRRGAIFLAVADQAGHPNGIDIWKGTVTC